MAEDDVFRIIIPLDKMAAEQAMAELDISRVTIRIIRKLKGERVLCTIKDINLDFIMKI